MSGMTTSERTTSTGSLGEHPERFDAAVGGEDLAVLAAKHVAQRVAHASVVVDDQHPDVLEMDSPFAPFGRCVRSVISRPGRYSRVPYSRLTRGLLDAPDRIADLVELALDGFEPLTFDDELLVAAVMREELARRARSGW